MRAERWREIEELYHAALAQAPDQRARFLDEACAQDSGLRHEVESLLAQQTDANRLLDSPAWLGEESLLDAEASQTLTRLSTGAELGPYRILGLLGAGGMGEVYRARDTRLGREVALKMLPHALLRDPERQRRFLQEARTTSALNNPHIVTFFELASAGDVNFLVLECVAGQTLDRLITRKGLPLQDVLSYAIQIADALAAAHAAGVVHRDLKPANIIVSGKGTVKLLDFGLAKLLEPKAAGAEGFEATHPAAAPETSAGVIMGTFSYMSPEQAQGKAVDARSDIFSFGCVLYEMITGQRASQGDSPAATLSAILRDEPKPLSSVRQAVPRDLEKMVSRCLRKDPERRWQHAEDVKVALLELQEETVRGVPAKPAPAKIPGRTWFRIPLVLAALMVFCGGAWFLYRRGSPTDAPLSAVPLTSYPGYELDPAFSPDGNQVAFEWAGEKRDNSDIYVKLIGSGEPLRLTTDPARDHSPAWSPDGRWVAFLREISEDLSAVLLMPALGGAERQLAETPSSVAEFSYFGSRALTWSPDGKWLVISDQREPGEPLGLFLLSIDTGEKRQLTSPPRSVIADRSPAFSTDGQMLAFSRTTAVQASDLYILRLSPGLRPEGEPKPLTEDHRWNDSPTWLADGHEILFSSNRDGNRSLWIVNASGANSPRRLPFVGEDSLLPAVSRQAHRLVYAQSFQDINIWRMNLTGTAGTRGSSSMLISSSRLDANGDYSPDGRRIAFQSDRLGSFEIWICDSGGSHARPLTSFGHGHTGSPRWSPDGKSIAFDSNVEGQFQVYVAGAEGGAPKRLTDSAFNNIVPSWSRDGAWIYFTSTQTGAPEIWKMPSRGGKAIQVTRHGGLRATESPDGRRLFYLKAKWKLNNPIAIALWEMPVDGGAEKKVLDGVLGRSFFITGQGIYYARREQPGGWSIRLFQPATGTEVNLAHVEKPAYLGFSVSPDGRSLLYAEIDQEGSDLMMVEDFR